YGTSLCGAAATRFDFHQTPCVPVISGAGRLRRRRKSGSHRTPHWRNLSNLRSFGSLPRTKRARVPKGKSSKLQPPRAEPGDPMGGAARTWQVRRCNRTEWSAAMPQPNDLSRSLVALDQNSTIIAVVELSQSSWLVGGVVPGIERQPRKKL